MTADDDLIELRAIALKRILATCGDEHLPPRVRLNRVKESLLLWLDSPYCPSCGQALTHHADCTQGANA